jgi:hypothetical protein
MDLLAAIKIKLDSVDNQVESAWRSDWDALYEEIQPGERRTVRSAIDKFPGLTMVMLRTKAAMMMDAVLETLEDIPVCLNEDKMNILCEYVLNYFDFDRYLQRIDNFIGAIERKFGRTGRTFKNEDWRTDIPNSLFSCGVKNTILDLKKTINADFTIMTLKFSNPKPTTQSKLSTVNQGLELKPNFCGIGINLNALIEMLSQRLKKK